jgi:hypothetical protein
VNAYFVQSPFTPEAGFVIAEQPDLGWYQLAIEKYKI